MVSDGFFKGTLRFSIEFGRGHMYNNFKRLFKREFPNYVINIHFCVFVKLFFVKWSRIK